MPMGEYEDFDACVRDNSDKRDPGAYCAAIKRQIEGAAALSESEQEAIRASDDFGDKLLEEDPCWEDYVMVGTKTVNGQEVPNCVPEDEADAADMAQLAAADDRCGEGAVQIGDRCVQVERVDAPASLLSQPRIMASSSPLDTQPIEREELSDGKVAYRGLKLIDSGVWTDSNSETPTLYDSRTFENVQPKHEGRDGPPVNIAHDIHKDGPNAGEPHEASIGGHIDPKSLDTDGEALFGDVILDTDDAAGAFADENLKSALENDGTAGFSPSVELMPTELRDADHPRAEEYVAGAELTGLGLVRDPASKSVDLAHETQNRAVAMAASDKDAKALYLQDDSMSSDKTLMDANEIRETLDMFGFDGLDEMTDDEVMDMAEDLHEDLMADLDGGEGDEEEGQEMGDYEDDEDEDEEMDEMADGDDEIDAMQDQLANMAERLEELEDAMSDTLSEGDVEETREELSAAKDEIETLREEKKELSGRVETLEEIPKDAKTLAEGSVDDDIDWSDAETGYEYDSATGSLSK